jgi:hypothetical protein
MGRSSWLVVGLGLILTSAVRAEETYTLKIKEPAKGDVFRIVATGSTVGQSKLVDTSNDKTLLDHEDKSGRAFTCQETILEKDPEKHRPTRLKRTYDKAQVTTADKTEDLPYQGKTVLIERKGKEYEFRIDGGEALMGPEARLLAEEFNKTPEDEPDLQKAALPQKAVAVNESWQIDMAPFASTYAKATQLPIIAARSEGTGKLVRVFTKDGVRFGVIALHLEMPLKEGEVGKEGNKMTLQAGGKWVVDITLEGCIDGSRLDGSRKTTSQFNATGQVNLPTNQQGKVILSAKTTAQETLEEVKK